MSELYPGLPAAPPPPRPITAAAVILWRDGPRGRELYWALRGALRFAGGFYAFPGGRLDAEDAEIEVAGLSSQAAALAVCAAREVFEETGVLLATGERKPSPEERRSARRALLDGALSWKDFLSRHRLAVDAARLAPAGRWITPDSAPIRYDAHVFLAALPEGEEAEVWPGELMLGEWIPAGEAEARWARGEVLLHPPNLWGVQCLARAGPPEVLDLLRGWPWSDTHAPRRIEFQKGLFVATIPTPTLPPAAHTNVWMVDLGDGGLAVVDPGSPWPEAQALLDRVLADLEQDDGLRPREIWLTHAHGDHVGGIPALRARHDVVLRAHPEVASRLSAAAGDVTPLADGELLHGRFRALHTPGHARGHMAFLDEERGALLAGDMVSTLSTIVVDPPDGDMADYLRSLERLRDLGPRSLFPAHGPPTQRAVKKLEEYLAHRREREAKVLAAAATPGSLEDVTARAYDDSPPFMLPVAARSCLASLEKLEREGRVAFEGGVWRARHGAP
jgi:glyoxylase-like metal-dependent hydrolase (beta-lactamase superfamily II)/8-oxo-dGTP pyrophosphatase MutT (NUDIX family)